VSRELATLTNICSLFPPIVLRCLKISWRYFARSPSPRAGCCPSASPGDHSYPTGTAPRFDRRGAGQPGLGGLSLALSLLTESSARGHWSAVVGVDDPGVVAMADLGVDLRRVLFVPRPRGAWAESAADLLDGVDLLIVRPPSRASHGAARRLIDRVRERGTVLIVLAEPASLWPLRPTSLSTSPTRSGRRRRDSTRVISPCALADAAKQFARVSTWWSYRIEEDAARPTSGAPPRNMDRGPVRRGARRLDAA